MIGSTSITQGFAFSKADKDNVLKTGDGTDVKRTVMRWWFGIRASPKFPFSPNNLTRELRARHLYSRHDHIRDLKGLEKATIHATCRIFALDPLADSYRFPRSRRFFRDVSSQKSLATRLVSRKLLPSSPAFLRRWKNQENQPPFPFAFTSRSRGRTCATIFRIRIRIAIKNIIYAVSKKIVCERTRKGEIRSESGLRKINQGRKKKYPPDCSLLPRTWQKREHPCFDRANINRGFRYIFLNRELKLLREVVCIEKEDIVQSLYLAI